MTDRLLEGSLPVSSLGEAVTRRGLWSGLVVVSGVALGVLEAVHVVRMVAIVGPLGVALEAVLPLLLSAVLAGIGTWLYRSEYRTDEIRRIVGWMAVGAAAVGLLFAWSLSHQYIAGEPFPHARFVMGTNLVVGILLGTVVGGYDVRTRRHRRTVEAERTRVVRERTKLAFLNRELRHHVLNGINVVQGRLDQAVEGEGDLEAVEESIDGVVETVQRVRTVTQAMDPGSRGKLKPCDLSETVRLEVDRLRTARPDASVEADVADGVTVRADDLLPVVVANLLRNAVQHNDREPPTVRVSLTADGESGTLRIADDGPGIDEATRRAVAEWGAASVDSTSPDVGIGYAIVGTAVERYGGEVRFEDRDDRGTVVVVEVPLAGDDPVWGDR